MVTFQLPVDEVLRLVDGKDILRVGVGGVVGGGHRNIASRGKSQHSGVRVVGVNHRVGVG